MYNEEDRKWLYDVMKERGIDTGTYDEFKTSLNNDEDRQWYYDKSKEFKLDVGTKQEFDDMMWERPETPAPADTIVQTATQVEIQPASVNTAQAPETPVYGQNSNWREDAVETGMDASGKPTYTSKGKLYDDLYLTFNNAAKTSQVGGKSAYSQTREAAEQMGVADMGTLTQLVGSINRNYAKQEAKSIVEEMMDKMPERSADPMESLRTLYYDRGLQNRLYQTAESMGNDYQDYVNMFVKPQLKETLKQKYGGDDNEWQGVQGLFSNWQHVGDRLESQDVNTLLRGQFAPDIDAAINAADERAAAKEQEVMKDNPNYNVPGTTSGFGSFGASAYATRQGNELRDPDKILKRLIDSMSGATMEILQDENLTNEIMSRAQAKNMSTDEYIQKYVVPQMQQAMTEQFQQKAIEREMPKSTVEYILRGLTDDSIVGMIYNRMTKTDSQQQYRNMADAMSGEQRSVWEEGARLATGMASDFWLWGGWGKIGAKASGELLARRIAERAAAEHITISAATRLIEEEGKQYLKAGIVEGMLRHIPQSAVTLGGAQGTTALVRGIRDREKASTIIGNTLAEAVGGAATGTMFGFTGGVSSRLTSQLTGVKRLAGKLAGFGVEASTMYTAEELQKMANGEDAFQNPYDGLIESGIKLGFIKLSSNPLATGMKLLEAVTHPVASAKRAMTPDKPLLTEDDVRVIRESASGAELMDALTRMRPERKTDKEDREGYISEADAEMAADAYRRFMTDPERSWVLKNKVAHLLGGTIEAPGYEVETEIVTTPQGVYLKTRDIDGNLIEEIKCDSREEAERLDEDMTNGLFNNRTEALRDKINNLDAYIRFRDYFENAYQQIAGKVQRGEELTKTEKQVVFLHQHINELTDIYKNLQAGEELSEINMLDGNPADLVDLYVEHFNAYVQQGKAASAYERDYEAANNLPSGYLNRAITGHSEAEAKQMAEATGEGVFSFKNGKETKWRTYSEQKAINDYQASMARDIRELERQQKERNYDRRTEQFAPESNLLPDETSSSPSGPETPPPGTSAGGPETGSTGGGTPAPRSERRDAAYQRGMGVQNSTADLPTMGYEQRLVTARLMQVMPDGSSTEAIRRNIMQSVENGDVDGAEGLLERALPYLNETQVERLNQYLDAAYSQMGVDDVIAELAAQYEEEQRQQLRQIADSHGMITPLTLRDGSQVYLLAGDLSNHYDAMMVTDGNGNNSQHLVSEIVQRDEPRSIDDFVADNVNAYADQLMQQYQGMKNGSVFSPDQKVDMIVMGQPIKARFTTTDQMGNLVFTLGDNSHIALRPEEAQQAVMEAEKATIQQQLRQDAEIARIDEKRARFTTGIKGYSWGQPDLTDPETDAKTAAEYLLNGIEGDDQGRKLRLNKIDNDRQKLMQRADDARRELKQLQQWIAGNEDIATQEDVENTKSRIAELESTIADAEQRRVKWGEIRRNMMTEEEIAAMEQQRRSAVFGARNGYTPQLPQRNVSTNDSGITVEDGVPNFGLTSVGNTNNYLLKNFEDSYAATQFINDERIKLRNRQRDEVQTAINERNDKLNAYISGTTELAPDEIKQLVHEIADLEALQDNLSEQAVRLREIVGGIPALYERNGREEELTPEAQRAKELAKASSREDKLRIARTLYTEYPEALDRINDQEPRDLDEFIAANLGLNSMNWEGLDRGDRHIIGVQQAVFGKNGGTRGIGKGYGTNAFNMYLAPTGQGKGFDEIVHAIYEAQPDLGDSKRWTTEDIANGLINMLLTAQKPSDISHRIIDNRIAEAEEIVRQAEEYEREMEEMAKLEELQQWAEAYHLNPEEREIFEDYIKSAGEDFSSLSDDDIQRINTIFAEDNFNTDINEQNRGSQKVDSQHPEGAVGRQGEGGEGQVRKPVESADRSNQADEIARGSEESGNNQTPAGDNVPGGTKGSVVLTVEDVQRDVFVRNGGTYIEDGVIFHDGSTYRIGHKVQFYDKGRAISGEITGWDKETKKFTIQVKVPSYMGGGFSDYSVLPIHIKRYDEKETTFTGEDGREHKGMLIADDGSYLTYREWINKRALEYVDHKVAKKEDNNDGEEVEDTSFSARLARAIAETNTNPTEAQKQAGNYRKPELKFGGYTFRIENPKGSIRSGVDASGKPWSIEMHDTYGYIEEKTGKDGDKMDFFINDDADLDTWKGRVFVIDQKNEDGTFDEHKVMYGYPTLRAARKAYESNYEDGWWDKHVMGVVGVRKAEFDKWLADSDHKLKPFADYYRTKMLKDAVRDNVDQLLADVTERKGQDPIALQEEHRKLIKKRNDLYSKGLKIGFIDKASIKEEVDKVNSQIAELEKKLAAQGIDIVTTQYTEKQLEEMGITTLSRLIKKAQKDAATSRVLLATTNVQPGSDKENTLKLNIAQAEVDIKALTEARDSLRERMKQSAEDAEAGGAVVDHLQDMGVEVSDDAKENRKIRKKAESDNSQEGKIRHMRTSDGKEYGFIYRGKMHLDPTKIDANLPLHEYGHLWGEAFRRLNPGGWKEVVNVMKQDADTWKFVKQLNPDLESDDDIAEEMIAKGTGERGKEKIRAEFDRMAEKDPSYKSKWNNIWKNISKAIQDFWRKVGDFLHIKYETPEQVYDQVLKDFANGVNPRKKVEQYLKQRDGEYEAAVRNGDTRRATEIFNKALKENVGNGMTPFIAVDKYRKMSSLAHKIKEGDKKAIDKAAKLMAPLIPENAVLIPTPSHNGKATTMLDLCKAIAERTGSEIADILESAPRASQYEVKKQGNKAISAKELGITVNGELPEGKVPVVVDNVVDTGNTAEACIKALGTGIVASLADSSEIGRRVASLRSAAPIIANRQGEIVPLSQRFDLSRRETARPVPTVDTLMEEVDRRLDAASDLAGEEQLDAAILSERESADYEKGNSKIRQRATDAVLTVLDEAKVPVKKVSQKEADNMMQIFTMLNSQAIAEFARNLRPDNFKRYAVIDVRDPFAVPKYFEKQKYANEFKVWARRSGRLYEVLDLGYGMPTEGTTEIPESQSNVMPMIGWHGSGAKFDAFDHSFIGTGEGNQTFGWGTYVSEVEGVGRGYAKRIGDIKNSERQYIEGKIEEAKKYNIPAQVEYWENELKRKNLGSAQHYLYGVEIPEDDGSNYIDYYGKMQDQQGILDKVDKYMSNNEVYGFRWERQNPDQRIQFRSGNRIITITPNQSGADLYEEFKDAFGAKAASEILNAMGITGIKVPVNAMRGGNQDGSKNYVIFNENDAKITERIEFMFENESSAEAPVFYSNALKAVEGIRQEKATPEQWIAMIAKNGGLKAGEEKWLELADWIDTSNAPTLTKQEIIDYIRKNQIQIEETHYQDSSLYNEPKLMKFNEEFETIRNEIEGTQSTLEIELEDFEAKMGDKYGYGWYDKLSNEEIEYMERFNQLDSSSGTADEKAFREMENRYGEDFRLAFEVDGNGHLIPIVDYNDEPVAAAKHFLGLDNIIHSTRSEYTTYGLDNKREIALTVPTIEPYNQNDEIHFGDAGGGRAVVWIRFGETNIVDKSEKHEASKQKLADYHQRMSEKYGFNDDPLSWDITKMSAEDIAKGDAIQKEYEETFFDSTKKVLVIDEIQSKRHQDGREKGYTFGAKKAKELGWRVVKAGNTWSLFNPEGERKSVGIYASTEQGAWDFFDKHNNFGDTVPDAPFDKNWHELAMKRMLRYAAENGYDKIAWTTGAQQAERYSLGHVLYQITTTPYKAQSPSESDGHDLMVNMRDGTMFEMFVQPDGTINSDSEMFNGKNVAEVFGKELGKKIVDATEETEIKEEGLRIGGEGMKGFYDEILPRFMNKYGKKWGVKVGEIELPDLEKSAQKMWSIDVTPEMKESVMQGQPMFQKGRGGKVYGWTDGKQIYLTPLGLNPNSPMHEYTHIWDQYIQKHDPDLWKEIVAAMKKTAMWQQVRENPNYRSIWNDDNRMASEVHSRLTGARSQEEFEKAAAGDNKDAQSIINEVRNVLRRFWEKIAQLFGYGKDRLEEFVLMPLRDALNGFNPIEGRFDSPAYAEAMVNDMVEKSGGHKQAQLEIILRENPMHDDYHTGIRKLEDIKSFDEAYEEGKNEAKAGGWEEYASYPDITNDLIEEARKSGKIDVYSSHPIKNGTFVTPSLMQAKDYAGGERVYSKRIPLDDVAWINLDEGQYAKVDTKADIVKRNQEYAEAVKFGDKKKIDRMLREEAKRKGYSDDSNYQGSLAFNGAAPSKNGYFETREERKEAFDNGDFEGEFSLGDYAEAGIDANDLEWQLNNPMRATAGHQPSLESIRNLNNAIKSGKGTITMYRAVDANIKEESFRNGDWVTPSREYAEQHIGLQDWKKGRIIEQTVSIDDIWWNGDDINEWGYDDGKEYAYKNTKNNRKLLEPTYDEKGNLIPLSKRFNSRKNDILFQIDTAEEDNVVPMNRGINEYGLNMSTLLGRYLTAEKKKYGDTALMGFIDSEYNGYVFLGDDARKVVDMTKKHRLHIEDGMSAVFLSEREFNQYSPVFVKNGYMAQLVDRDNIKEPEPEREPEPPVIKSWVQGELFGDSDFKAEPESTSAAPNSQQQDTFDPTQIKLRKLEEGETCHVERKYQEYGAFSFTGKNKIESIDDVAYIFKQLETAAIENSFLALIKDGIPTVIHLGVGNYTAVIAEMSPALLAYNELNPDKVYFIHNHPSGNLQPSAPDVNILNQMREVFGDKLQPGIIIDTTSGLYGEYVDQSVDMGNMPTSAENEVPVKIYSFTRQVFDEGWNPITSFKAATSDKIAEYISSHRLGKHKKMSLIIMNQGLNVTGNVFLPWTSIKEAATVEGADLIARYMNQMGGTVVTLYGNYNYTDADRKSISKLNSMLKARYVRLMDVVHIDHSAYASGIVSEPEIANMYAGEPVTDKQEIERLENAYEAWKNGEKQNGLQLIGGNITSEEVADAMESKLVKRWLKFGKNDYSNKINPFDLFGIGSTIIREMARATLGITNKYHVSEGVFNNAVEELWHVLDFAKEHGLDSAIAEKYNLKDDDTIKKMMDSDNPIYNEDEVNAILKAFPVKNNKEILSGIMQAFADENRIREEIKRIKAYDGGNAVTKAFALYEIAIRRLKEQYEGDERFFRPITYIKRKGHDTFSSDTRYHPDYQSKEGEEVEHRWSLKASVTNEIAKIIATTPLNGKLENSVLSLPEKHDVMKRRMYDDADTRFNNELDAYKNKQHKGLLHLGKPGLILRMVGVDADEMNLSPTVLHKHLKKQGLNTDELKGLAVAVQYPILVYKHGKDHPNMIVVTEMDVKNGKLSISLEIGPDGHIIEISNIRSIHSKNAQKELDRLYPLGEEVLKENIKWVDKEKVSEWLLRLPYEGEHTENKPKLDLLAKIVKDSDNPSISYENLRKFYAKEVEAAEDTAEMLGGEKITFEAEANEEGAIGWYDPNDGSIHVVLPGHADVEDVKRTVCHEKLGHEGMVALLGNQKEVNKFGHFAFRSASKKLKQRIIEKADDIDPEWKDPLRYSHAAQEVLADIAENGPRTADEFSLWDKIKHYIIRFCNRIGLKIRGLLNDHDMAYYILKTGEALKTWKGMSEDAKREAAAQGYDKMYRGKGKPRKRNNESMAQYLQRLREWEKWKIAEEKARENNDPMPTVDEINDKWEAKYKEDLAEWKQRNGITDERPELGVPPEREPGESWQHYGMRIADYGTLADKWNGAPNLLEYMSEATGEYRRAFAAWKERYDIQEEESVDLKLYEGEGDEIKTPEDLEVDDQMMQDLAQSYGVDLSSEGAQRHAFLSVIRRRKNLGEADSLDALWIHNMTGRINEEAKRQGVKKSYLRSKLADIIEGTYFEDVIKDDKGNIISIEDISDQLPIKMTPELKTILDDIKRWYDDFYTSLVDNGLKGEAGYIPEGYVNHVWDRKKSDPKAWEKYFENRQRTKSRNMNERIFETYRAGEDVGLVRRFDDICDILAYYSVDNNKAIANKRFLDDLSGMHVNEINSDGEVVSVLPLMNSGKPDAFVYDRYELYFVPGVGEVYVIKDAARAFDTIFGSENIKGLNKTLQITWNIWSRNSSIAKKTQLALSGFHGLALFEVDVAQNPIKGFAHLFKYIIYDSMLKGVKPAYAHPEDFKFAAKHLVKLGATDDYAASDVRSITGSLKKKMLELYNNASAGGKIAVASGLTVAAVTDFFNKGFDIVLWEYIHDGLKLAAFKELARQVDRKVEKNGLSMELREKMLDEAGQYVNDMFGGQHWEVLNVTPMMNRLARDFFFLSHDWTVSSMVRLPSSTIGLGGLYTEKGFMNYLRYWKRKFKGEKIDEDYIRDFRMRNGLLCYLGAFLLIGGVYMQLANMWNKKKDKEREDKIAEEMRKVNPDYKSPYELKYPDGMKWYDYTMLGNTMGHKTHLFMGRYDDGRERYSRWGKHFREVPELAEGEHGLDFPAPLLKRLWAKKNPNWGIIMDIIGIQGVENVADYHYDELVDKYGRNMATLIAIGQNYVPFGISLDPSKEWYPSDFFMPSSKGYSPWKAKRDLEYFMLQGDMKGVEEVYNACVMNGVDYDKSLQAAMSSIEATQRKELADGVIDLPTAAARFDAAKTEVERKQMKGKMIKYLAEQNYKAYTRDEAVEKVRSFLDGDQPTEEDEKKYTMLQNHTDVTADYRLSSIKKQAKKYVDEVKTADPDVQEALATRYRPWIQMQGIISKADGAIGKLKKQLGKKPVEVDGVMYDDKWRMEKIREIRTKAQHLVDSIQSPR